MHLYEVKYARRKSNCSIKLPLVTIVIKVDNTIVHAVVITIDEHRVLYHNAMCIDHSCIAPDEMVSIRKGLKNVTW